MTGTSASRAVSAIARMFGMIRFALGVPSFPVTKSFTMSTINNASLIGSPASLSAARDKHCASGECLPFRLRSPDARDDTAEEHEDRHGRQGPEHRVPVRREESGKHEGCEDRSHLADPLCDTEARRPVLRWE